MFSPTTVLSVDYLNVPTRHGWRFLNINPLLPPANNPAGPRVRALAADLQRVYGDPALLGPVQVLCSCNDGKYDGVDAHLQRRRARPARTATYKPPWGRRTAGT